MPVQLIAWNCAEKVTAEEHELGWAEAQLVLFPSFQHHHKSALLQELICIQRIEIQAMDWLA